MTVLNNFLEGLGTVFTEYVPELGKGIYEMFLSVFTVQGEAGAITGLNELGYLAVGIIGIGIVTGLVSLVMHVLRLRGGIRRQRRAI